MFVKLCLLTVLISFVVGDTEQSTRCPAQVHVSASLLEACVKSIVKEQITSGADRFKRPDFRISLNCIDPRLALVKNDRMATGTLSVFSEADIQGMANMLRHEQTYAACAKNAIDITFLATQERFHVSNLDLRIWTPEIAGVWHKNGSKAPILTRVASRNASSFPVPKEQILSTVRNEIDCQLKRLSLNQFVQGVLSRGSLKSSTTHVMFVADCQAIPTKSDLSVSLSSGFVNAILERKMPLPETFKTAIGGLCTHFSSAIEFEENSVLVKVSLWDSDLSTVASPTFSVSQRFQLAARSGEWSLERVGNIDFSVSSHLTKDEQDRLKSLGSFIPLEIRFRSMKGLLAAVTEQIKSNPNKLSSYALESIKEIQRRVEVLGIDVSCEKLAFRKGLVEFTGSQIK